VAHIDGEECWVNGERYTGQARELRQQIISDVRTGRIEMICNRYVMREGIDIPELAHIIFACLIGSLTGFLQAGGRVLRAAPGKTNCVVQDHGGHWWRHGSLNADRHWELGQTAERLSQERMERLRNKEEPEPIVCPICAKARPSGKACPKCGHIADLKMRRVIEKDGTLKWHKGDIVKPRRVEQRSDTEKHWLSCYYRIKKRGGTLAQARGLFFHEHKYYPPEGLRMMPKERQDWYVKINAVPASALHSSKPE
jgi:superfamily II DNA or RNA helicase